MWVARVESPATAMPSTPYSRQDSHAELSALYRSLLGDRRRFAEFKQLLSNYPPSLLEGPTGAGATPIEPAVAAAHRQRLNQRLRSWVGDESFRDLSATQVLLWRAIVVEQRFDVDCLTPQEPDVC